MKKTSRESPVIPAVAPKPVDPQVIAGLANLAEHGVVVTGDLNDGSFVALMVELRRRGNEPIVRSAAAKQLKPFMVVVAKVDAR